MNMVVMQMVVGVVCVVVVVLDACAFVREGRNRDMVGASTRSLRMSLYPWTAIAGGGGVLRSRAFQAPP
jgi:hypothetical protein